MDSSEAKNSASSICYREPGRRRACSWRPARGYRIFGRSCKPIRRRNPSDEGRAIGVRRRLTPPYPPRLRGTVTYHDRRQQSCSVPPTGRLSGARSDCQATSAVDLQHREPETGLRFLPRGNGTQSGASSRYTAGPQQTSKRAEAPQVTAPVTLRHSSRWRHLDFRPCL